MSEKQPGIYKKIMGTVCHHCPFCKYWRNHPESMICKMLHHKVHADHCPMWKAEKEVYESNGTED